MALIKVTQEDIDRSKPIGDGVHQFKLLAVTEEISKNDKTAMNYNFDFECIASADSNNISKHTYKLVSSKAVMFMGSDMFCALLKIAKDELNPGNIDTDAMLQKTCQIQTGPELNTKNNQMNPGRPLRFAADGVSMDTPF